jgi:hypothetical protein
VFAALTHAGVPYLSAPSQAMSKAWSPLIDFNALDTCVRSLRDEMIAFTSELVAIPSENPPGTAYPDCVRAIEARLHALDLPSERVEYRPTKGAHDDSGAAVVLSSLGTGQRTLYFSGHYDVVPVTIPGQCAPVLKGKTLFGRGSADMKVDWRFLPCSTRRGRTA